MKEITVITGYEAFDGERFETREECEAYEKSDTLIIKQQFIDRCVKHVMEDSIPAESGFLYWSQRVADDYYTAIIRIENEDDLNIAVKFQEFVNGAARRKFTQDDIGKDLLVDVGAICHRTPKYDWCYIYGTIDECLDNFRNAVMMIYKYDKSGKEIKED